MSVMKRPGSGSGSRSVLTFQPRSGSDLYWLLKLDPDLDLYWDQYGSETLTWMIILSMILVIFQRWTEVSWITWRTSTTIQRTVASFSRLNIKFSLQVFIHHFEWLTIISYRGLTVCWRKSNQASATGLVLAQPCPGGLSLPSLFLSWYPGQCCGSRFAWIRIQMTSLDPDPTAIISIEKLGKNLVFVLKCFPPIL